jgi:hypothetical protein
MSEMWSGICYGHQVGYELWEDDGVRVYAWHFREKVLEIGKVSGGDCIGEQRRGTKDLVGWDIDDPLGESDDGGEWVGGVRRGFIRWWGGQRGTSWECKVFECDLYVFAGRRTFGRTFPSNSL